MSSQSRFQQALAAHQQGDLDRARSGYLAILEQHPQHHQARHLLGVCAFQAGHADEALTHINTAIAQAPGVAEYHNNLGEVLRNCARPAEAEKACRQALQLAPDDADAHNNLALILQSRGDIEQAIEHLRRSLQIQPQAPQSAANLANVLRLNGDPLGACESFRQALALAPEFAEARLALCQLLLELERDTEALDIAEAGLRLAAGDPAALCARACVAVSMAHYREAAQLLTATARANPQSASVQMTLGRLLLNTGDNTEALRWLEQAVRQIPAEAQLQSLLSRACLELNRLDHADEAIRKALQLEPDNRDFQIQFARICRHRDRPVDAGRCLNAILAVEPANRPATQELAMVFLQTDEPERAQGLLEQALARAPDNHDIRERLASVLLSAGKFQSSIEHLSRIISNDPERIISYRLLSQAKHFSSQDEPILVALAGQLESQDLAPPMAAHGHFALGKMLADCGRHGEAFKQFQQANQIRRPQLDYDSGSHEALVQEHILAFDRQRLERLAGYGNPGRVPIIICGMPRSGTTLVERILASHPRVSASGEVEGLTRIYPRPLADAPRQNFLALALDGMDAATIDRLGKDYLALLQRGHPDADHVTDKTPENFLHLGLAAILCPQAPLIHCHRHPLATCLSNYSTDMTRGGAFGYRIDELAHYYGQYQQIMGHWHGLMPGRIFDLRYERLVTDFETVCRELLAFCELEWDPRCLEFHTTTGTVLTASDWQVRQPLYTRAVNNWRHYQTELEPLRQALAAHGVALD